MPLISGGGVSAHSALSGLAGTTDDHPQYFAPNKQRVFGYFVGGTTYSSTYTGKYDDVANTWTAKTNLGTSKDGAAGFSLNGFGYNAGGSGVSAVTEKYDDVANTWTAKANLNTARSQVAGFSLNGFGYTAGGYTGAYSAVTEKYDDVANTWTAKANLNTARSQVAGFSLNGFGYTAGGTTGADSAVTEKYDDVANTWTAKTSMNTARSSITGTIPGFSINGFGYNAGGGTGSDPGATITEKYDDVANTWTQKTSLGTARYAPGGFSLNGFGYVVGGYRGGSTVSAVTEKYDDVANTWTAKTNMNTASGFGSGFSLGYISDLMISPELFNYSRSLKSDIGFIQSGTVSTAYTSTVVQFPSSFPIPPQVMLTAYQNATVYPTTITSGSFTFNASSAVAHAWTGIVKTTSFRGVA